MKSTEIELTFLARSLPQAIKKSSPIRICDVYIPEDSDYPFLRLRQSGKKYEITKKVAKTAGDSSVHHEDTISLSEAEFMALKKASHRQVEKDRYQIIIDSYRAEVDVFVGMFAGLVMIDFEFANEEERHNFTPPTCCLADVTQQHFAWGGQLAGLTYADIQKELEKFQYKKLTL